MVLVLGHEARRVKNQPQLRFRLRSENDFAVGVLCGVFGGCGVPFDPGVFWDAQDFFSQQGAQRM